MGDATLGGQVLVMGLIVGGIAALLWVSARNAQHVAAVLTLTQASIERVRAAQQAELLEAVRANGALLRSLQPVGQHVPVVLIVDDDESALTYTSRLLIRAGYTVRTATSGEAAIAALAQGVLPDLIVTDMRLLGMNGLEFARQIRTAGCQMPIVAYSAYGSQLDAQPRRDALEAGCNDFVMKTGEGDPLLQTIARWLAIAASVAGRGPTG